MTQITGAFSVADAKVEISANGSAWTDVSGASASVAPGEQTRKSGEAYTNTGDVSIITGGKREPLEIEVKMVYTEGTGDAFETIRAAFEAKTPQYLRWTPKGTAVGGEFQFTTPVAFLTGLTYPETDASSGDPAMYGFKVKTSHVVKSVLTT